MPPRTRPTARRSRPPRTWPGSGAPCRWTVTRVTRRWPARLTCSSPCVGRMFAGSSTTSSTAPRRRDHPHRGRPSPQPSQRAPAVGVSDRAGPLSRGLRTALTLSRGPMVQGGQAWCVGRSRGAKRGHFDEQREVADRPGTGDACQDRQPLTEIATGSAGGEKLGVDGGESRRDLPHSADELVGRPPSWSEVSRNGPATRTSPPLYPF